MIRDITIHDGSIMPLDCTVYVPEPGPEPKVQAIDTEELRRRGLELRMARVLNSKEYRRILSLTLSPDEENHVMAEQIINAKIKEL